MATINRELADLVLEKRSVRRLITQLARRKKKLDEDIFRIRYELKMSDEEYQEQLDAIFAEDAAHEKALYELTRKKKTTSK